jgi:hypothetical protein
VFDPLFIEMTTYIWLSYLWNPFSKLPFPVAFFKSTSGLRKLEIYDKVKSQLVLTIFPNIPRCAEQQTHFSFSPKFLTNH